MHSSLLGVFVLMFGIVGWSANVFYRSVVIYCDYNEGTEIDWGKQAFHTLFVPFGYTFPLFELMLIYG